MGVEDVDDLGEIRQRSGQPVNLVDDDDLNLAGRDVFQQPLEGRALHRAAGEAAVIIHVRNGDPSRMTLTDDIGVASLALRVEGIELLLESVFGRFSGVNRAAETGRGGSVGISPRHEPLSDLTGRPMGAV